MTVVIPSDGHFLPPQGVHGGRPGSAAATYKIEPDGSRHKQPNVVPSSSRPGNGSTVSTAAAAVTAIRWRAMCAGS